MALLAYIFGQRHAFGFFFSLGHSTVVVLATAAIALSAPRFEIDAIKDIGGLIGTTVSALFLLAIALVNLVNLHSVWSHFRAFAEAGTSAPSNSWCSGDLIPD